MSRWIPNRGAKISVVIGDADPEGVQIVVESEHYAPIACWTHDGMTREQVESKIGAAVLSMLEMVGRANRSSR